LVSFKKNEPNFFLQLANASTDRLIADSCTPKARAACRKLPLSAAA